MPAITIRDIPEETHRELRARAARSGRSLQEYLCGELVALATRPDVDALFERIDERRRRDGADLTAEQILAWRDADRR